MKNNDIVYKSFILRYQKEVTGIFFHNPFFKKRFDIFDYSNLEQPGNVYDSVEQKGLIGLIHYLLNGKGKLLKIIDDLSNNSDIASYRLLSIRSPVYFKRIVTVLRYTSDDLIIESQGWHKVNEEVSGYCQVEHTKIQKRINGQMEVVFDDSTKKGNGYNLTYKHRIEQLIKDGDIFG